MKLYPYPAVALLFIGMLFFQTSCKKAPQGYNAKAQFNTDTKLIQNYLSQHNLTAQQDPATEIFFHIDSLGSGISPAINDTVSVIYSGILLNGTTVVSSDTVQTGPLIASSTPYLYNSWSICLPFIKVGGGITIYAQSFFSLQDQGTLVVPANSVLIFHVNLVAVKKFNG